MPDYEAAHRLDEAGSSLPDLSLEAYLAFEERLMETGQGRAFLRMRDRRTRLLAIDDWRRLRDRIEAAVTRLESGGAGIRPAGGAPSDGAAAHLSVLEQELRDMRSVILQARSEIAALRPKDLGSSRILAATGELDAIVVATERATSEILGATERIQDIVLRLPDAADTEFGRTRAEILDQVMAVLTACSFQDITGQRTTKVVNTLRYIEQRVNAMMEMWGVGHPDAQREGQREGQGEGQRGPDAVSHRRLDDDRPDAHLLNGPALGDGIDQDAVDRFFDAPQAPASAAASAASGAASGAMASQADIDRLFD